MIKPTSRVSLDGQRHWSGDEQKLRLKMLRLNFDLKGVFFAFFLNES